MHHPNHGYQQNQLQPQNNWAPVYQNQYPKYESIDPRTNSNYQPAEYLRDYDLNGYHPNNCHWNDYYIYPEDTSHQSHESYHPYAQPFHNGYQKHGARGNQPKNNQSYEYTAQGQPAQGQNVQGQPGQGQIYQGNAQQNYVCLESKAQYPGNVGEHEKYSKYEAKGWSLNGIQNPTYGSKSNYDDYGYLYDQQYHKTSDAAHNQNICKPYDYHYEWYPEQST
jgi:hypothetical protein